MSERSWTKDEIASFDNEWVLLHLIFSYREDFGSKDRKKWSEETCDLWDEAVSRMKDTVVHGFDKKAYMDKLNEEYNGQSAILESAKHDYSYHYGIKSGLDIAIREFRKAVKNKHN